jgi:hypothetical protein
MAHVGKELGFVLACFCKLTASLLNFAEQPRVLDRQHRLVGKRSQKLDRAIREFSRYLATDHQRSHDLIRAQ